MLASQNIAAGFYVFLMHYGGIILK